MKNNVIYTLEEPEEEANKTMLPRKKRKELEYEKRLKDKTGNIYDLLGDDNWFIVNNNVVFKRISRKKSLKIMD